ncbi:MAG: hypothetical protein IT495_15410 [Gammaproteobacteria bacterium]|nr:hypothetical protein [Gammaproteobacteria bacterium]
MRVLACCALLLGAGTAPAAPLEIRLAYVGEPTDAAWLGAGQGLAEANTQGRFLGQRYALERLTGAVTATDLGPYAAIVAAVDAARLPALAIAAGDRPVLNVTARDDSLRTRACRRNLLHVLPSAAMYRDAQAQWQAGHPGSRVTARAWHPAFEKYAAAQLNNRYQKTHDGERMDDRAWAGWAAVKLLSDSVARAGTATPGELLDFIRTGLEFDGQKGVDMSIRPNGQLRQPMLLVDGEEIVGEAPVRGVSDDLDSLGASDCAP